VRITGKVKLNTENLQRLQATLDDGKNARVKVGVLAGHNKRDEVAGSFTESGYKEAKEEMNNADIGAVHELGSEDGSIPRRSFLEMPIINYFPKKLKTINKSKIVKVILKQSLYQALAMLGVLGEQVVDEAFATRGHGTWAPNTEETIKRKGSDAPLIDKGFLRKSITSKVYVEGGGK
jgi:hypothetical protein